MKVALSIGGSDPTSGAGVQMDLRVFQSLGVYGLTIITAVTAQSTKEFSSVFALPEEIISRQFETLLKDIKPHAAKTGMLYSKEATECVIRYIKKFSLKNIVVDPVITATLGTKLIKDSALKILKEELIPLSFAVTANIPEAEALTQVKIKNTDDIYEAAEKIHQMGTEIAIVKGGHLKEKAVDLFYDGKTFYKIQTDKIPGQFHGTGCAFSSAFVSFLCHGYKPKEAFKASKNFIEKAIKNSVKLGNGINLLIVEKRG